MRKKKIFRLSYDKKTRRRRKQALISKKLKVTTQTNADLDKTSINLEHLESKECKISIKTEEIGARKEEHPTSSPKSKKYTHPTRSCSKEVNVATQRKNQSEAELSSSTNTNLKKTVIRRKKPRFRLSYDKGSSPSTQRKRKLALLAKIKVTSRQTNADLDKTSINLEHLDSKGCNISIKTEEIEHPKSSSKKFTHPTRSSNKVANVTNQRKNQCEVGLSSSTNTHWKKTEVNCSSSLKIYGITINKSNPVRGFHRCKKCPFRTTSVFAIENHVKWLHNSTTGSPKLFECTKSNPEMYPCSKCDFQTYSTLRFNEHVRMGHTSHPENSIKRWHHYPALIMNSYSCRDCHFDTFSQLVLATHECGSHVTGEVTSLFDDNVKFHQILKKIELFDCEQCSFQSIMRYSLEQHVRRQHEDPDDTWLKCECSYRTHDRKSLLSHVIAEHAAPSDTSWCKCELCSLVIKYKHNLITHVLHKHTTVEIDKWFKCEQCFFKTKFERNLEEHIRTEHYVVAIYTNPEDVSTEPEIRDEVKTECASEDSSTEYQIVDEIKIEHTPLEDLETSEEIIKDGKRFKCEQCPFRCKHKTALKKHTKRKHTTGETLWFKCEQCPFKSKYKGSLKSHNLVKHTPPEKMRWFACEHCSYKTLYAVNLRVHKNSRIHKAPESIEWFKCEKCSYITERKCNLRSHVKWKHVPVEDYVWFKCEQCEYKVRHRRSLSKHKRTKHN